MGKHWCSVDWCILEIVPVNLYVSWWVLSFYNVHPLLYTEWFESLNVFSWINEIYSNFRSIYFTTNLTNKDKWFMMYLSFIDKKHMILPFSKFDGCRYDSRFIFWGEKTVGATNLDDKVDWLSLMIVYCQCKNKSA